MQGAACASGGDGWPLASGLGMSLQQGCGHPNQGIRVLQSPPLPVQGLRVLGSSWECGMELYTEHCSWWQAADT